MSSDTATGFDPKGTKAFLCENRGSVFNTDLHGDSYYEILQNIN